MNRLFIAAMAAVAGALLVSWFDQPIGGQRAFAQKPMMSTSAPPSSVSAPAQLTECFAVKLWVEDGETLNAGKLPNTVKVPAGWFVAGGTTSFQPVAMGGVPAPAMVLCKEPPTPASTRVSAPSEPLGHCSGAVVMEMVDHGLSKSFIDKACSAP